LAEVASTAANELPSGTLIVIKMLCGRTGEPSSPVQSRRHFIKNDHKKPASYFPVQRAISACECVLQDVGSGNADKCYGLDPVVVGYDLSRQAGLSLMLMLSGDALVFSALPV